MLRLCEKVRAHGTVEKVGKEGRGCVCEGVVEVGGGRRDEGKGTGTAASNSVPDSPNVVLCLEAVYRALHKRNRKSGHSTC
jgi:hypothetical protein